MFLLKLILALIGLITIVVAVISFISGMTGEIGFAGAIVGVVIAFFVLGSDKVSEFLSIPSSVVDSISFGAFVGGSVICAMDFRKLGGAMITVGWIGIGLILLQIVPIPFIANLVEIAAGPFVIACIPLLLILMFFI